MAYQLIVEGWRFLPHSYAVVNQFQCLEILKRKEIELFHQDFPYYGRGWVRHDDLFSQSDEVLLKSIKSPSINQFSDATLRMDYPHRLNASNSKRTYVFMTSEFGYLPNEYLQLNCSLGEAHRNSDVVLITPSNWSKEGLIRSGADSKRVALVPCGIDPIIYKPLEEKERLLLRKQFGIEEDEFVFLSIGGMYGNKGIHLLLRSFVRVLEKYPNARLLLKGADTLFDSRSNLKAMAKEFLAAQSLASNVLERVTYIGLPLTFSKVAELYQLADAYVSPYLAEGFNLPVLEAAACGLPVICTKGGSTDDFTNSDFTLHIDSQVVKRDTAEMSIVLSPNLEHLTELMHFVVESDSFRKSAKIKGSTFVSQQFTWKHVVNKLLWVMGMKYVIENDGDDVKNVCTNMSNTVNLPLKDYTITHLNLSENNLIIFPNWNLSQELIITEIEQIANLVGTHPDSQTTTLLIEANDINIDVTEAILSDIMINFMMKEDVQISEGFNISFVSNLDYIQWKLLLPQIRARIIMKGENQEVLSNSDFNNIPLSDFFLDD